MPATAAADLSTELDSTDVAAGLQGTFAAVIGQNLGTPSAAVAAGLLDVYGQPLDPTRLFIVPGQPTNSLLDSYGTYMRDSSLSQYVIDFNDGRSLMLGHAWGDQPIGQSFRAVLQADGPAPPVRAAVNPQGTAIQRIFAEWYIQRGLHTSAQMSNDDAILAVESRTMRDLSIGFDSTDIVCDLCGLSVLEWDCPHIPNLMYDVNGLQVRATAGVEGGHILETSFGFKGATPQAGVVPVKARMVAQAGRLTAREQAGLRRMEARLGRRLLDPAHFGRVRAYSVPGPVPQKDPTMPVPPKSAGRRDTNAPAPPPPANPPPAQADQTQVIADEASGMAQGLVDQLNAVDAQITALQGEIDAQQGVIDAASAGSGGNAPDPAEVAALNQQMTALQDQMTAATDELAALNAQLAAVNGAADATGGTAVPSPLPDSVPTNGPPPTGANMARIVNWVSIFTQQVRTIVAPTVGRRDVAAPDLQPILDALNAAITALQQLVDNAGGVVPQTGTNAVIADMMRLHLAQAAGAADPRAAQRLRLTVAGVRGILQAADAGRDVRETLLQACITEQRTALGVNAIDEGTYRQMLGALPVAGLRAELTRSRQITAAVIQPGRRLGGGFVIPPPAADPDRVPDTAWGVANAAQSHEF